MKPLHAPGACAGGVSRRALAAALGLGALLPQTGAAMWAPYTDAELLQRSDLVVLGSWVGQSELGGLAGGARLSLGAIAVTEVLKGAAATTLALVVVPGPDAPRSGNDLSFRPGDRGLWLLRKRPGTETGLYLADHPQRFVPAATGAARIETLRKALARP